MAFWITKTGKSQFIPKSWELKIAFPTIWDGIELGIKNPNPDYLGLSWQLKIAIPTIWDGIEFGIKNRNPDYLGRD